MAPSFNGPQYTKSIAYHLSQNARVERLAANRLSTRPDLIASPLQRMVPGAGVYRESAGQLFPAYFSKGKRAAHNRGLIAARGRTLERRPPR